MKTFLISGLIDDYRIKTSIFAISPNHAIKVFQQKYPNAIDIYVIQNLFNKWINSKFGHIWWGEAKNNSKFMLICIKKWELLKKIFFLESLLTFFIAGCGSLSSITIKRID